MESNLLFASAVYASWLADLDQRIEFAQQRSCLLGSRELILLYCQISGDILKRQQTQVWCAKLID